MRSSPVVPVEVGGGAAAAAGPPAGESVTGQHARSGHSVRPGRVVATRADVLFVGCWSLVAMLVARAAAPALPGSTAGIGPLIVGVEELAGFSSQFMAVMGVSTCVRLLLSTLEGRSGWFRLVAIVTTAAGLPVVISASSRHLTTPWLIALVALSAALGLAGARPALRAPQSRAAGLVLLTVTLGSLVSAFGRVLALYASQQVEAGLFGWARGIATAGLLLDAVSVALAALWVVRRWRYGAALIASVAALAAGLVWIGAQGVEPRDAAAWQLFVARALAALTAHPDPFVQSGIRYFVEISAIFIAAVTLWSRRPLGVGETLCFALLARVSGDVPSCALMLMLAALCAVRASLQPVRPHEAQLEPSGRRAPLEVVPVTR
ncbi:MAG TPA: hypothetical protein VJU61_16040 [Polyangiaceae bacterium]|nr:hypothetical protein [Polyangiaceae bacterium]